MYEVEVKVRADHGPVRERLAELGAERRGAVEQVDTYYDAPHRAFAESDEALRVRREMSAGGGPADAEPGDREPADGGPGEDGTTDGEPTHELTYKGPKVDRDSKTREEHETAIGDPEALAAALRAIGFEPAATVEKRRERYALRGYTVALDEVDGLGTFVEVEREAPEGGVDAVRDGALALLADLGLDPDEQVRTSYLGLLLGDGGSQAGRG